MSTSEPIDPSVCPMCEGRLLLFKSRVSADGITTQYRRCECGTKTTDRVRKLVVAVGSRRIVMPNGEVVYQSNPHSAESAPEAVPAELGRG